MNGGAFTATLWDDSTTNFARLSLKGTVRHGRVAVRVIINNTDVDPFRISGELKRVCWEGGGREILFLSDGVGVIGLFREIPSGRCAPVK